MKLSRYNIEKKEDKSCLIYNTVTSAILELDTDYEKSYYEMKEGKKCSKPDLESALLEGGMLVEDDKDEFAELLIRNKIERFADSNLTLTIAPTMACNFCCPYCYEKGREYITMSETVQDQLTSQLKEKYQHIHELTVSWYGGEPLLAIETIEKLTKRITLWEVTAHIEFSIFRFISIYIGRICLKWNCIYNRDYRIYD